MKISSIRISNVLSFPYSKDIDDATEIRFDGDTNILIGQNGAGKSTILEIINFVFKRAILCHYSVERDFYGRRAALAPSDVKRIVQRHNDQGLRIGFRLDPNWNTPGEDQLIRVSLKLDSIDIHNIKNIVSNIEKYREIADRYSLESIAYQQFVPSIEEVVVDVKFPSGANNYSVSINHFGNDIAELYLTRYNFLRELALLYNAESGKDDIPPLFESFALIGGYRNYNNFVNAVSLSGASVEQQIQAVRIAEISRSANGIEMTEPTVFSLVRLLVAERHYAKFGDERLAPDAENHANNLPFLSKINDKLSLIGLKVQINLLDKRTWQYSFLFIDTKRNKPLPDINSLSAGQKAIVHLVFEAYGRGELKGGVVIIDEPEIHLHYQFQHEYLRILEEINSEKNCQYIIVTHSESLINSNTIGKVRRVALNEKNESIICAPVLEESQRDLVKILDNTRSTYAFFSKKVVLVEGDSDRYLFRAIFKEWFPDVTQDLAILDVGGKGGFKKWKRFFESFGLKVYCVGDFDNVLSMKFSNNQMIIDQVKKAEVDADLRQGKLDSLSDDKKNAFGLAFAKLLEDKDRVSKPKRDLWKPVLDMFINFVSVSNVEIVEEIRRRNPGIDAAIQNKYSERIFILKKGAIESYVGGSHADMAYIANFCSENLSQWCSGKNEYVSEIRDIVEKIVNDPA
ncbi:AAA family ATPase [Ralstonia pickettii]|uniref:AAA family ATPase n=1 Tax=Ralstonia pickettii TaxID=329 RepID=UPI0027146C96|nr:AAA family ATPase [Ralstonia pickettii]WKZ87851.1 AAA family ATPase [Ralstonia pickettii]